MTADFEHPWLQIQRALRSTVGERTYDLWLAPLRCVGLDGDTLVLDGPPEVAAWAQARYTAALRDAAAAVLAHDVAVSFAADATSVAPARADQLGTAAPTNPKYTFEQFIIGTSNRLAHAAALAVAEMPAQAYNPLFIHGPPGLGKTHLLHAIANYIDSFGGGLAVRYVTAEEFTNAFLAALGSRDTEAFKARFRGVDVLLIDDVQFLERKARSEEEMFHTFNTLYEAGSQLVLTCDRVPANLAGIEERLRERFAGGLITDISRPDRATRLAILRKRAAYDGVQINDDALTLLADVVDTNVRALEGALIRAEALSSLEQRKPIDLDLAQESLARNGFAAVPAQEPTIAMVQAAACSYFDVTETELLSQSRVARVVWARHVAMYLARELTSHPLAHIAREFGHRDHTTVLHASRRVRAKMTASHAALRDVELVAAEISTHT